MTDYKEMLKLLSAEADAEGAVLLEDDGMLPLAPSDRIAVFGRRQFAHYKSGTGSGGRIRILI